MERVISLIVATYHPPGMNMIPARSPHHHSYLSQKSLRIAAASNEVRLRVGVGRRVTAVSSILRTGEKEDEEEEEIASPCLADGPGLHSIHRNDHAWLVGWGGELDEGRLVGW